MTDLQIVVHNLSKTYRVPVREEGLLAALGSLGRRKYKQVRAVHDISFSITAGEMVGLLGPDDAGKTTTLKMLAGLLYPTSGEVRVAGFTPWKRCAASSSVPALLYERVKLSPEENEARSVKKSLSRKCHWLLIVYWQCEQKNL